jgi:hypothetical protein
MFYLVDKFFPDNAEIPKLNENEKESCEGMISEEECVKAIKSRSPSLSQHAFDLIIAPSVFFSKYVFK